MNFTLKVILKNDDLQQIYEIRNKKQEDLEGLIYLLNETIIKNSNNSNFDIKE